MHKLERPLMPEGFAQACEDFRADYPPSSPGRREGERWEAFKNEQQQAYKALKNCLYENQCGLCAYCETVLEKTDRQIEHFIPKSLTTADDEHTICFENYTMSCKGCEKLDRSEYSCGHRKGQTDPRGRILNPYDLPDFPLLQTHISSDGLKFIPDEQACSRAGIEPALVESTLACLGLNSSNLQRRRLAVWQGVDADIVALINNTPPSELHNELSFLAHDHLDPEVGDDGACHLKSFYTTRLLCLAADLPELLA